ncbi:MAG: hypothetical protein E6767_14570 [Dysgonomonas sp.]|nr:hypothetical protein [Dysgonomonas sp.]
MKIKVLFFCLCLILLAACSATKQSSKSSGTYGSPNVEQTLLDENTFKVDVYSEDSTYGYTEKNPIMVGGSKTFNGPRNERRFLNALMGAGGEPITYHRIGSCCGFDTKNGMEGKHGLLDKYSVMHKGLKEPVILYINMYDSDLLKIPVGFKKKKL